ncbi:MAG: ferrous iron transport protein B [Oscillospiraceae bacterium]|nr:ferrous iron transport protein B [Oscillospiraceae bacterium]
MAVLDNTRTLEDLAPGQRGTISSVGNKSASVKRRLVDMGLTPGTEVLVKKIAPFGDPIEVCIRGYELSIRREDARQIDMTDAPSGRRRKTEAPREHTISDETLMQMQMEHAHEYEHHSENYDHEAHDSRRMYIALAGNPNCGKTTLFNALTGANQYVGNWPGVTVEKKEGVAKIGDREVTIVDLPGIYSLSPYSMEEIVTRDYIIGAGQGEQPPDAIINIVDATNIERNMYLTIQLLELERPMVVALNFMDEARKEGDEIDAARLSKELGVPVVPISAKTGENLEELLQVAHMQMHVGFNLEPDDLYDEYTHEIHHRVSALIHDRAYEVRLPAHWASIKLLEGDYIVEKALDLDEKTKNEIEEIAKEYESSSELGDRETLIADSRYAYIESVVRASVKKGRAPDAVTLSDRIDRVATHKVFAVPVFLLTMLIVFAITFGPIGSWLSDGVAYLIDSVLAVWVRSALESLSVAGWLVSLICDGIIAGVGGVLTFLPQIALLFLFLSLLEDSGYMSRAAFIMDRLMRRFGLSGKAFIPMLMGFGCSVPAVMGARTMENEKDRRMTIMLIPFMSCAAKLPVYGLITSAFFGAWAGLVVFCLYVLGLVMAVISGLIFKKTLFAGEPAAFVLELPPYRMPSAHNTLLHVWERVKGFLIKAGTVLLIMSIVLWFLQSFDIRLRMTDDASKSILAGIGSFIAPAFRPQGFGMWQAAVALLTGLVAKEAVVSSLSMFYGFSITASGAAVAASMTGFTPLSALAFLVFVLLYVPCVAAVSAIHKEMNSLKWTGMSVAWQIVVAYIVSALVFQAGRLLGF